MKDKDRELKPCPFCGGKAENEVDWIFCKDCGVGYEDIDIKQAISAWNKRSYKPLGKEELIKVIEKHKWSVAKYVIDNKTLDVGQSS